MLNNIEKIVKKGDYNYCVVRDHPNANKYGYVLHHRAVMENYLGRYLLPDEVVHHIDHNKKNNSIENLELTDPKSHGSLHTQYPNGNFVLLECALCLKEFKRRYNLRPELQKPKNVFCSRSCNGKYYKFIGRATG